MPIPITVEQVMRAIQEHDQLGRDVFLKKYKSGPALEYLLIHEDNEYDSKAIVRSVYTQQEGPDGKRERLTGGVNGAATILRNLGFDVVQRSLQNVPWTWDEHVLALELYMRNPESPPGKESKEIAALSQLLRAMADREGKTRTEKFRNANGVYMKLMNFRRFDKRFKDQGKVGLEPGNSLEGEVWKRYSEDLEELKLAASLIQAAIEGQLDFSPKSDDEDIQAQEGSLVIRVHKARERDRGLIRDKKADVLAKTGRLACEVCDLDYSIRYGDHGHGFIEIHHINPIALSEPGRMTKLSELAAVCSSCHRMLHRGGLKSIDWLRSQLA